jgi:hypothetical protein
VTVNDVSSAIYKLNSGKSDGNGGLCTDHFKNSCGDLHVYLSFLFSSMLLHDAKGKNINLTDSNNYRGIALSSIFGKIFDLIFLSKHTEVLCTSDLQFGFKSKRSTNQCSMVLKEAIAYYVQHGSYVYCTMLDATKAFDRVNYCKLFRSLVGRR